MKKYYTFLVEDCCEGVNFEKHIYAETQHDAIDRFMKENKQFIEGGWIEIIRIYPYSESDAHKTHIGKMRDLDNGIVDIHYCY